MAALTASAPAASAGRVRALAARVRPRDLVARATSDSTLLGSVASTAVVQLGSGAVTLVGAIVLMAVLDAVLLGVALAVLVAVGLAIGMVMPRILRAAERQQAAVGVLGAALERALGALRTVKASGAERGRPRPSRARPGPRTRAACAARATRRSSAPPPGSSSRSRSSRSSAWAARGSRAVRCRSAT